MMLKKWTQAQKQKKNKKNKEKGWLKHIDHYNNRVAGLS